MHKARRTFTAAGEQAGRDGRFKGAGRTGAGGVLG
jgi:hypothetical protein